MPNQMKMCCLFSVLLFPMQIIAQPSSNALPWKGMAQHNFLMTGEWDHRKAVQTIFLISKGKMIWNYEVPFKEPSGEMAELGDASMRPNGNIVFSRKTGAAEVTPAKTVVWNYDAPPGTEIHSIEPIGNDRVLMVINAVPATAKLINIQTGVTEKEVTLPTGKKGAHLQFRRVRMTPAGTLLASHLDSNVVAEYDWNGRNVWSVKAAKPWSATRLANGNTLINSAGKGTVTEVNKNGDTIWELSQADVPQLKLFQMQTAVRLVNGNTVVSNWCVNGIKNPAEWPGSVQYFEVTPDKKIVWILSQWSDPDLGPGSSIQMLDETEVGKSGYLDHY
jgi:hypothetical protein